MERKHEYQTKSRQMILDYLIRNKDRAVHVSDIIRHMDQEECSVNKTTVYRYLDHLSALCLIFMFTFHLNSCFLTVLKAPLCKLLFYAVSICCHIICFLLHILSILYLPTAYSNYCCKLSCICTGTP